MKTVSKLQCILIAIVLIAICCYGLYVKHEIETKYGITIHGGLPLKEYSLHRGDGDSENPDTIRINGRDITIEGNTDRPVRIACDAGSLTLQDLCQKNGKLELSLSEACCLKIKGANELDHVLAYENLSIEGCEDSSLAVHESVYADGDLTVSDLILNGRAMGAGENIRIQNLSQVCLKSGNASSESAELMYCGGKIIFSLTDRGAVSMECDGLYMTAQESVSLGKNNVIVKPEKGRIKQKSTGTYDGKTYYIYDSRGKRSDKLVIKCL